MHQESVWVAGGLFLIGLVLLSTKLKPVAYVFIGLGGLMLWAGAAA